MSVQFIEQNGVRQYAIIPAEDYDRLLEKAEMLEDIQAFDKAIASDDELVPAAVVGGILAGESKLKVWREHRGLSQAALAEKSNVAQATIAQIEGGKRIGSLVLLKKVALALGLDLDDLIQ